MSERMGFKNYVTPGIIALCWWGSVVLGVIIGAMLFFQTISFQGGKAVLTGGALWDAMKFIVYIGFALFGIRLWLEFLSIIFSIHDRLIDLAEILEQRPSPHPSIAPPPPHGTHNPLYAARRVKG